MTYGDGVEENWSVRDDRPYLRPAERSYAWPVVLAIALVVGLAGAYYYLREHQARPAPAASASAPATTTPLPQASPQPAIRHPLETPQPQAAQSLPALDNSDALARRSLVELMGDKAFAEIVVPRLLIRRIVATIDNLPRTAAPRRMIPLDPVPGAFIASGDGNDAVIAPANFARYAPYVRVMESVAPRALVSSYARAYPLFQRAYEELGYPGKYFNDRLMQAIDDLLAAPEIDAPIEVIRPRILYEFADPDLETRSAGQKIMIRMGKENASRVKAKLWEIRRELIAASARPQ
jgi:uncharacterized membrane protein